MKASEFYQNKYGFVPIVTSFRFMIDDFIKSMKNKNENDFFQKYNSGKLLLVDDVTVIFGHTPTVCYGNEHLGKIVKTDTWVNVDVGVGIGQEPALLRLDDMKRIYYNLI